MNEQGINISELSDIKVITKEKIMAFIKGIVATKKPSIAFPHRIHNVKNEAAKEQGTTGQQERWHMAQRDPKRSK